MTKISLKNALEEVLAEDMTFLTENYNEICIGVERSDLMRVMALLKDHALLRFALLLDICGVDYPARSPRFDVVYHLLSIRHNHRLRVKVPSDGIKSLPSMTSLYSSANWCERETWDLYGIPFENHPDMRRLLTDYNFEGHPFRKDFPLTGYEEVRYDKEKKKVVYEPVSLRQDYRVFDFLSPWEGMLHSSSQAPSYNNTEKAQKPDNDKA